MFNEVKDTTSLYIVQISNLIIPLVTLPWLAAKLGLDMFGIFGVTLVILSYFNLAIDYGFNLKGVKDIATNSGNVKKQSQILISTLLSKFLIFFSITIVLLLTNLFGLFSVIFGKVGVYILIIGSLNSVINPIWFLQGVGKLPYASISILIFRLASLPILFIYVKDEFDLNIALGIQIIPGILSSFYCLYFIYYKKLAHVITIQYSDIKHEFITGFIEFKNTVLSGMYMYSHTLIVSASLGVKFAGLFYASDRIIKAFQALMSPLSQSIFHIMSIKSINGDTDSKSFFYKRLLLHVVVGFLIFGSIFLSANIIVINFFGEEYVGAVLIIQILSIVPMLYGIHSISYIQILTNDKTNIMSYVYFAALIIFSPVIYMVMSSYGLIYGSIGILIGEILIASVALFLAIHSFLESNRSITHG
jgi:polysaccharide transporter, PST family